jgi:hypothetical protein
MALLSTRTRLAIPDHVITRAVGGSTVILDVQSGRSFTLDDIGSRVWALLEETGSIAGAVETLSNEFAADRAQIEGDVLALVQRLADGSLVTLTAE